jgi:hypothetical protein
MAYSPTLKLEALGSSETLVPKSIILHIPIDCNINDFIRSSSHCL